MSGRAWSQAKRAFGSTKPLWWIAGPALTYAVLRGVLARAAEAGGLFTPTGTPSIGLLVLGLGVLALRLLLLFVVPAVLVYRGVEHLLRRAMRAPPG